MSTLSVDERQMALASKFKDTIALLQHLINENEKLGEDKINVSIYMDGSINNRIHLNGYGRNAQLEANISVSKTHKF